jgi:thymidylate kinase
MSDPTAICMTGGDGSGKSTQIDCLTKFFEQRKIATAAVSVWDAFTDPAVVAAMPIADPSDIYRYLKLLGPNSRPHFLFHALHLSLERALERRPQVLLLDGYWYKYFAAEIAHGADPAVLRSLAAAFPEPNVTFHLAIGPQDALRRKFHHSDYESGYGDDAQAFLDFQEGVQHVLIGLAMEFGWIDIEAQQPPEEVTKIITFQLEERGYGSDV